MTLLSTDKQERKNIPIYSGFVKYFPLAMAAVAELSKIGNDQHNPGQPLHWAREKSGDELDALMRHLLEAGTIDIDGVRHSTKLAWRAMANLQKEIEKDVERMSLPAAEHHCGLDAEPVTFEGRCHHDWFDNGTNIECRRCKVVIK